MPKSTAAKLIAAAFSAFGFLAFIPAANAMCGVVMKDGKPMMMKDGKATAPMTSEKTMTDGTKLTTSGVLKMKDGAEKQLGDGDMVLMNGHVLKGGKATPMQTPEDQ